MQQPTGELALTIITIIAVGAVIAIFWWLYPVIRDKIKDQWDNATDDDHDNYNPGWSYSIDQFDTDTTWNI